MQSILAAVLAFVQSIAGFFGIALCKPEAEPVAYKDPYPIVFIHGFGGYGEDTLMYALRPSTGDLKAYLASEGYEAYMPTVGPMSSAWDRACELYACLTGTRADYGEAHAKEHGHDRYGADYKHPLVEDWSTERKIYVLGHSFGGPTMRMFSQLCEAGSQAERDANQKNISPLFAGKAKGRIAAVVALAADHNGVLEPALPFDMLKMVQAILAVGSAVPFDPLQLGHIGLTTQKYVTRPIKTTKQLLQYLKGSDLALEGALVDGMTEMNKGIQCHKSIYYFSYVIELSQEEGSGDLMSGMMRTIGAGMSAVKVPYTTPGGTVIDSSWLANDGIVPVVSARYPFNEPHKDYNPKKIEKGIWQVMPLITSGWDHATFALGTPEVQAFYLNLAEMLAKLPKG